MHQPINGNKSELILIESTILYICINCNNMFLNFHERNNIYHNFTNWNNFYHDFTDRNIVIISRSGTSFRFSQVQFEPWILIMLMQGPRFEVVKVLTNGQEMPDRHTLQSWIFLVSQN